MTAPRTKSELERVITLTRELSSAFRDLAEAARSDESVALPTLVDAVNASEAIDRIGRKWSLWLAHRESL